MRQRKEFGFLLAGLLVLATWVTSATAATVKLTYTSQKIDLSGFEQWERDWMALQDRVKQPARLQGLHAMLEIHLDCFQLPTGWTCAEIPETPRFNAQEYTFENTGSLRPLDVSPVRLGAASGFTDRGVYIQHLDLDMSKPVSDWTVTAWQISGFEAGQVGDFSLSDAGDVWTWLFESPDSGLYYCTVTFGWDSAHTTTTCANGTAARRVNPQIALAGVGTWEIDTSALAGLSDAPLISQPLPAGWVMLLSGAAAFACQGRIRRRRRAPA